MQQTGYVAPHGEIIKVLARHTKTGVYLKWRDTGKLDHFFSDETIHLEEPENADLIRKLRSGEVIFC